MLDETARSMTSHDADIDKLRRLYDREGFRVSVVVWSYSAAFNDVAGQIRVEGVMAS